MSEERAVEAERGVLGRYGQDQPEPGELVTVRLLRFPVRLYLRATEHHDELIREFALLAANPPPAGPDVPARLLALIEALGRRYGGVTDRGGGELRAAVDRGDDHVDLTYELPVSARAACLELEAMLEAADEFCRADGYMLTLAATPELVAFRGWYFREIITQLEGGAPSPWEDRVPTG